MTTVRERLLASGNDYTPLEESYRRETGGALVIDPYGSYRCGPRELTRTASVVIASYNSRASLELSLISLESTMFNRRHPDLFQVVVVDDGSTDGTAGMVESLGLDLNLRYVRQERAGMAAAHNTGVAFCDSDVVIIADSDIVHLPYGIDELMKRHQVLDGVVLVGFRFEMDPADPRLRRNVFRSSLRRWVPDFLTDFRLSFPGRPANMCRETDHLKRLGYGRTLMMANGAKYNLPAMVVGALFSVERKDFEAIGGSDERLRGWGCEDSLIGARCIALGDMVIPVYGAASGHITHPPRDATQAADFQRNIATAEAILDEDWSPPRGFDAERFRGRATDYRVVSAARRNARWAQVPSRYPLPPEASRSWADYLYGLGRYAEALDRYEESVRREPQSYWAHLGAAKTKRELRAPDAPAAFDDLMRIDRSNPWGCFEGSLAFADAGDYARARKAMSEAGGIFEHDWALRIGSNGHKTRGNHHASEQLHAAAATDFALAVVVDPANTWAHFDRGTTLRALGRLDDAVAAVETASGLLHPDDANQTWPHAALAELHLQFGNLNRAKLELERALELYGANDQAIATEARLADASEAAARLRLPLDAHDIVATIPGWLAPTEASVLAGVARLALERHPAAALLELGSFCGKSTCVIAAAIRSSGRDARLTAVDPHEGYFYSGGGPTAGYLTANLDRLDLRGYVDVVIGTSLTIPWSSPIGLLFIDALHDYEYVAADFGRFAPFVLERGVVAFHDYGACCPGVKRLVNEILAGPEFRYLSQRGDLIALERVAGPLTISPN